MIARIYLTVIGILYLYLSVWCSVDPATTSQKVGFERIGGSGKSEFLVIYGGLELAMALMFLLPWINKAYLESSLLFCVVIHVCLVLFRTASYFLYSDISGLTHKLAIGEWVILLSALAVWFFARK